jgi:hypothetical protein
MGTGALMMLLAIGISVAALVFVIYSTAKSIKNDRAPHRSVWREFGLGLTLMLLFFATWVGHAITQWQAFTDEARGHDESPAMGDFLAEFGQATLENWQSEFLQLFAFVTLSALYIHKGSAESKDSDEKVEASLRRIETHLGTLPPTAPQTEGLRWKLPETPLEQADAHA